MGAKRYKYIGTENETRAYKVPQPRVGHIFGEYECVGGVKVGIWANHQGLIKQEWEEVVDDEIANLNGVPIYGTISSTTGEVSEVISNPTQPAHYKQGKVECIEAIKSAVVNKSGEEAVLVGNVIKYLWRYESKGGITDVEKAIWYINHLKQLLDENRNKV